MARIAPLLLSVLIVLLFSAPLQAEFVAEDATLTQLTSDGESIALSWAYRGDLIAFVRQITNSQSQLLIMKSNGADHKAISPIGNAFFAEWSWAGKKLAYGFANAPTDESQAGLYVYDLDTGRHVSISAPYPNGAVSINDGPFFSADDKYLAYKVRPGPSRSRQVWVAEAESGKNWRLLAERGEAKEHRWSPHIPPRLSLLVQASGSGYDVATVDPDGRNLVLLTDIGAQSVRIDNPRWSPGGEWIAFKNDVDMTQSERDIFAEDCWVGRPDGSDVRNLTSATSPSAEDRLDILELFWSWDGRRILTTGNRFDKQGNLIPTLRMIDPITGEYEQIVTSEPRKTGQITFFKSPKWSYDNSRILFLSRRFTVKNWGPEPEYEQPRSVLSIYDVEKKTFEDILVFDEDIDRKQIIGDYIRSNLGDISFSPDNRSVVLTIATVVSTGDAINQPDVYRLDLPERHIGASVAQHIGPPIPRESAVAKKSSNSSNRQTPPRQLPAQAMPTSTTNEAGYVTELVKPLHMTVEEAVESLSADYDQYMTLNLTRNLLVFKGPPEMLAEFRRDLKLIDTLSPHILVDLMAVELTDEANRNLGLDWAYAEGHFAFFQPVGSPIQKFPHNGAGEDYSVGFPSGALDALSTAAGIGQSFYQGVGTLPSEFFIRLNSLVSDGEAEILANPRTVAMSGKESLINIRKTLNYFFNEGFDVAGRPVVKKSDISADTEGRITARLLPDGRIHLVVDVKVGTFTFTKDAGLPELTTRQSTTEVIVRQGETVVIGGLRQQEMSKSTTKVPILGDLPLLGGLFRQEHEDIRHSVLTILITPQVMNEENPIPDWPQLNNENLRRVPILKETGHDGPAKRGTKKEGTNLQDALDALLERIEE